MIPRPRTEQTTKLTIAGFAPSYQKANFKDPCMEHWIINSLYSLYEELPECHYERVYDMHRSQYILQQDDDDSHIKKLKELAKQGVKIFACEPLEFLPDAHQYPLDDIEKMVGINYFTNTITYLILHALYEKKMGYWEQLKEIDIIGVDMAQDGEFMFQRPSCELAIGLAIGMGIKVNIPPESDLCRSIYKYGYDTCPLETKIFQDKIENHKKQIEDLNRQRQKVTSWRNQEISKIEAKFNHEVNNIDAWTNQLRGAIDMSKYYSRAIFSMNGGVPFSPQLDKYDTPDFKNKDILDD